MNFRDIACSHLTQYKINVLGIQDSGLFHYRGIPLPVSHILPTGHHESNLLEAYRHQFFVWHKAQLLDPAGSKIKLHQFFHHLNSSQALCINLFYPLILEKALPLFLQFMGLKAGGDLKSEFEKASPIEETARRTSFDFYIEDENSHQIFVEVKYTENGFGRAKDDEEHRKKFRNTYAPMVKASPFLQGE